MALENQNTSNTAEPNAGGTEAKSEPTFEVALARLEEIVHALDGGDAPLDKSLALFEEGVSLVKLCQNKLDTAEQRVKILVRGDEGKLALENFTPPRG